MHPHLAKRLSKHLFAGIREFTKHPSAIKTLAIKYHLIEIDV